MLPEGTENASTATARRPKARPITAPIQRSQHPLARQKVVRKTNRTIIGNKANCPNARIMKKRLASGNLSKLTAKPAIPAAASRRKHQYVRRNVTFLIRKTRAEKYRIRGSTMKAAKTRIPTTNMSIDYSRSSALCQFRIRYSRRDSC
jgi:hypothetical protein